MLKNYNKLLFIELIHALPIAILTFFALKNLTYISHSLYLLFVVVFSLPIFFSIFLQIKHQRGTFFYLFSILMFLGFPFKFSMHEIFHPTYIEPVGLFNYSNIAFANVIKVALWGGAGILFAQIISYLFFIKNKQLPPLDITQKSSSTNYKAMLTIASLTLAMGVVNLKYNIILFGITPSIILPFKGNTIYFLLLTRFLPLILFFYGLVCFSYFELTIGALIFLLSSVGVTSRMIIVIYFMVITIPLIQSLNRIGFYDFLKKFGFIIVLFALTSSLTVQLSSRLRYIFTQEITHEALASSKMADSNVVASKTNSIKPPPNEAPVAIKPKSLISTLGKIFHTGSIHDYANYQSLATERWVGMEGLMAVEAHPSKGFPLLMEALKEPGFKNDGKSFYNSIADLKLMEKIKSIETPTNISTSVPGPIAFFYYTGSSFFVFLSMLLFCIVIFLIEDFFNSIFLTKRFVSIFISVFMTFDFYQFGISPIAFLKYWSFTFFCIGMWLIFEKHNIKRNAKKLIFTT